MDDTSIVVENDRTNEKRYEDEQIAIDDIEEELDLDIPLIYIDVLKLEVKVITSMLNLNTHFWNIIMDGKLLRYILMIIKERKSGGVYSGRKRKLKW